MGLDLASVDRGELFAPSRDITPVADHKDYGEAIVHDGFECGSEALAGLNIKTIEGIVQNEASRPFEDGLCNQ